MDKIRQKAQSLLEKLHDKYGVQSKHHIHLVVATMGKKEDEGAECQEHWYLVDTHGQKFRLPKTMLFLGREECDVVVASQSVDKRHAILAYDLYLNRFKVKDLSTTNGTFVNNSRIPEQEYVTLNHMDSIRLGQEAMMYHIEQASQITSHGGLLPDPLFIPPWASRAQDSPTIHMHAHPLAECQGCIAEQNLDHTCNLKHNRVNDDLIHLEDPHHCHHPNSHHIGREPPREHQQLSGTHPILSQDPHANHNRQNNHQLDQLQPQHNGHASDVSQDQSIPDVDQNIITNNESRECFEGPRQDHNTWPQKRHTRQVTHVGVVFNPDAPDNPEYQTYQDPTDRNVQTMFFVPFDDDSVGDRNHSPETAEHGMRPHVNKDQQPSELATVKKRAAVYGQPTRWSDEDVSQKGDSSSGRSPIRDGSGSDTSTSSPLSSLALSRAEASDSPSSISAVIKGGIMEGDHMKPPKCPTYMEIPLRDDDSSNDSKTCMATTKKVSSSLSKSESPAFSEHKQVNKPTRVQSPEAEVNPAMSFTIELDDPEHPPKKSLNIGSSISEFVPSKMRRGFQDRKSMSSKTNSRDSTSGKTYEEHDLPGLSQSKVDEIYSIIVEGKGKSRPSGTQAVSSTPLRPPNLEEISHLSEHSEEKRSPIKDNDRKGFVKRPVSNRSPQMSHASKVILSSSTKFAPVSSTASVSDYHDPTSYLIDKMFEGGSSGSAWPDTEQQKSPVTRDKTGCLVTEKAFVRPVIDSINVPSRATKTTVVKPATKLVAHNNDVYDDLQIIEDIPCDIKDVGEKEDKEDKVSEAGTYTIEADATEGLEEEDARKKIDLVFGVDMLDINSQQVIHRLDGCEDIFDLGDDSENTLLDDSSHSPAEDDTDNILDDFDDENTDMATTNGVQTWVSQLTSLTNQKSTDSSRLVKEESDVSLSKKPPQGVTRKRSGTGRKLPSIPLEKSPVNGNNLAVGSHNYTTEDLGRMLDHDIAGRISAGSNSKPGVVSSQPCSRTTTHWHPASPNTSIGSLASPGAEVPFLGTETAYKHSHDMRSSQNSVSDITSTYALVNGGEDYATPVLYKSPRDALAKRHQKDISTKPSNTASTPPSSLGKKLGGRLYSQTVANLKFATAPRIAPSANEPKRLNVSEIFSRKDSLDNGSVTSDLSSEASDANLSRSTSKGKGPITMTRTNKTFDLRRARAGSLDEPSILKSKDSSAPKSTKPTSSKSGASCLGNKSHSVYSSVKSKPGEDTSHIEAAKLAAQAIKKNQNSVTPVTLRKAGSTVLSRIDCGRQNQNQKLQRASSLTISHPVSGGKGESTTKSHLRSTPTNSRHSLTIKGLSNLSSKSQSQPGSRSNSPKAAEKLAWKRRKEYDARKSVAEAKCSKTKENTTSGITMRPKLLTDSSFDRRMIRSASFTNTAGLPLCLHTSVSSSQDFSDKRDSYNHNYDLRRSFLPIHNSHHNGRSTHSADEDDSIASATSTQDNIKNVVSLLEIPSAFTPPLPRNKPVSPESSSPSEASLSLRRRTLNLDRETSPCVAKSPLANGNGGDVDQRSSQASYDSLIAASVHQLSLKLTKYTDVILNKLREQNQMTHTPSPVDDFLNDSGKSEITAWRTANQELAGTLQNLRMLERHMQVMNTVLFPDIDINSEVSLDEPAKRQVKQKLLEDIERKLGFQPIDQPIPHPHTEENETASPEMVEFSGQF